MKGKATKKELQPILTIALFPELLAGALGLLTSLTDVEWAKQIPRKTWTVKDAALHLLGGDVGILSIGRDRHLVSRTDTTDHAELVAFLKAKNDNWIQVTRRISPRLLCELLRFAGHEVNDYFRSLDAYALGDRVSWAGPEPAPNWLDIAREYTERWHHHQHIREAVGRPGFMEPRFLKPALDTFVRALPYTYRDVSAPEGTAIELTISGDSGEMWCLLREQGRWHHYLGPAKNPDAAVAIPQEIAWKLWTRWFPKDETLVNAEVRGDDRLATPIFEMTSVIA